MKDLAETNFDAELTHKFDSLNLKDKTPRMPSYHDVFDPLLANKSELEKKQHLDLVTKIKDWPMINSEFVSENSYLNN